MGKSKYTALTGFMAPALAILLTMGCGGEEESAPEPVVRPVKTLVVGGGGGGRLTFPGTVQAADRAELSFRVHGPLVQLPVREGDDVTKGQLMAAIDPRDYRIRLAEARAAFEKAEADLTRYQRLYEQDAVPLSELELRRAQRDVARAKLDQSQADLRDTELRAPFGGWIGRRYVENFEDVQAKETIVTLHNLDDLEIVINVAEGLIAVMSPQVERKFVSFDSDASQEFEVTLKEVSAEADPATRTYQVTLGFSRPQTIRVLPGMTGTVTVFGPATLGDEGDSHVIPAPAVGGWDDGSPFVWIIDPQTMTVSRRMIQVGTVTGIEDINVLDGLKAGETIAVTGVNVLREGMKVRLLEAR